jgi:AraC-like DNA-binding protein
MPRIKDYIHQHLDDPALDPARIAAAAHISTRYLHKLFEAEHHTVALYIKGLRLDRARRDLMDPRLAHRPIAAVAHTRGFHDLSGFNRAFKAAYGVSPKDLRAPTANGDGR